MVENTGYSHMEVSSISHGIGRSGSHPQSISSSSRSEERLDDQKSCRLTLWVAKCHYK